MMFVQVIATMCHLLSAGPELCFETAVVSTDEDPALNFFACMTSAQAGLADWKEKSQYAGPQWRIAGYKCVPDRSYNLRNRA